MKKQDLQLSLFAFEEEPLPKAKKKAVKAAPQKPEERSVPAEEKKKEVCLKRAGLQQAAFAFLCSLAPDGVAEHVSVFGKKRIAAAGFWRGTKGKQRKTVCRSAVVLLYDDPEKCFAECADREKHSASLQALQKRRNELEEQIRHEEPHLAVYDELFQDVPRWEYSRSGNEEYRQLRRSQARELRALCQGSPLERLTASGMADLCYLSAPAGTIAAELVPESWGLVELFPELPRFRLVREAEMQKTATPEGRAALVFQIALASSGAARFASGVEMSGELRKPPRRRRRLE